MTTRLSLAFMWLLLFSATLFAQTTSFTYQGKLADNNGYALSGRYNLPPRLQDPSQREGLQMTRAARSRDSVPKQQLRD